MKRGCSLMTTAPFYYHMLIILASAIRCLVEQVTLVLYVCLLVKLVLECVDRTQSSLGECALFLLLVEGSFLLVCSKNLVGIYSTITTNSILESILGSIA